MTIQTLFDAWIASGVHASIEAPATEAEIQAAEATIGAQLPSSLREIYPLFNGGWAWELDFYPLNIPPDNSLFALANSNEKYIEHGWNIPKEIRIFAGDGGGGGFGIWLLACGNPIYDHPVIEVGELAGEEGCMGLAGTNLLSFLRGWSAFHLVLEESGELWKVELGEDKDAPNRLKRIQRTGHATSAIESLEFLGKLQVPRWLRYEHFDEIQYDDGQAVVDPIFHRCGSGRIPSCQIRMAIPIAKGILSRISRNCSVRLNYRINPELSQPRGRMTAAPN